MAAANALRQWAERQEQEPVLLTTQEADISSAVVEKRQLGIALTLGNAVFSVGLGPNGLPAFTIGAPPPVATTPAPTPAAPRTTQTEESTVINTPAPVPAPTPTTATAPLETSAIIGPAPSSEFTVGSGKHVSIYTKHISRPAVPY